MSITTNYESVIVDGTKSKALILAALMIAASVAAAVVVPEPSENVQRTNIGLESIVPKRFGDWRIDENVLPILPPPDVEAKVRQIYDEVLARTYINRVGERVMLSIAYGGDQTGRLRVHRPESCYSAQGFLVKKLVEQDLQLADRTVPVKRLSAILGGRHEPITYWIRVGNEAVTGLVGQRLVQLKFGLTGDVPDGLIFRVSSIGRDAPREFDLQDRFVKNLVGVLNHEQTARLVGAGRAKPRS
jgi:EpsI family protein